VPPRLDNVDRGGAKEGEELLFLVVVSRGGRRTVEERHHLRRGEKVVRNQRERKGD
jgi:hypothetical protein